MVDLAIAYRIYPGLSKNPAIFADDKLKLSALCLQSFRRALGDLRVKMWVLLDKCPQEYEDLFRDHFTSQELEILNLNGIGNLATFSLQIDLLANQSQAPLVYFAEDDYFYFPDALVKLVGFIRQHPDVDFVTAYDHSDLYTRSSSKERHHVRAFGDRHWRSVSSTCLTFLARRESLIRARAVLGTYSKGNNDCSMWLLLTQKLRLLNIIVHWHDLLGLKIWISALRYGVAQILFGRQYTLWSPLPTLATHMEAPFLAPLVDWKAEFCRFQDGALQAEQRYSPPLESK
jgi:hypothetical protein